MILANLSNSALDAAFANSWDARDYTMAQIYGAEIRRRVVDVSSFIWASVGMSEFPLYDARMTAAGGSSQVSNAQSSIGDAIANAPETIGNAAKTIVQTAAETTKPVLDMFSPFVWGAIVVGGIAVYAALRK